MDNHAVAGTERPGDLLPGRVRSGHPFSTRRHPTASAMTGQATVPSIGNLRGVGGHDIPPSSSGRKTLTRRMAALLPDADEDAEVGTAVLPVAEVSVGDVPANDLPAAGVGRVDDIGMVGVPVREAVAEPVVLEAEEQSRGSRRRTRSPRWPPGPRPWRSRRRRRCRSRSSRRRHWSGSRARRPTRPRSGRRGAGGEQVRAGHRRPRDGRWRRRRHRRRAAPHSPPACSTDSGRRPLSISRPASLSWRYQNGSRPSLSR